MGMGVQINLAEGVRENTKDRRGGGENSSHRTKNMGQAGIIPGVACKPYFAAKFKFKFITTNFIWALKV